MVVVSLTSDDGNEKLYFDIVRRNGRFHFKAFPEKTFEDIDTLGRMCFLGQIDKHVSHVLKPPQHLN